MIPARRRSAFTLLELVVVMLILVVTAAVVAPSLRGFTEGRVTKNTAAHIVALCHYARTQAVTEGRPYRLNVDPKSRTVWLTAAKDGADSRLFTDFGQLITMADETSLTLALSDTTAALSQQRSYIRFNPNGSQDVATVTLVDRAGSTQVIRCESPTEPYHILTAAELARR